MMLKSFKQWVLPAFVLAVALHLAPVALGQDSGSVSSSSSNSKSTAVPEAVSTFGLAALAVVGIEFLRRKMKK